MRHIGRRELLGGGVAALTAGVAVLPAAAAIEPHSQLAELMEEYRSAERSWGAIYDDKQADKYYAAHVRPMYRVIGGTPARTQQDALAAIDYLIANDLIERGGTGYDIMLEGLVKSIRAYIAGAVS